MGPLLGKGGFCDVNEINNILIEDDEGEIELLINGAELDMTNHMPSFFDRKTMSKNIWRGKSARYAIKRIKEDLLNKEDFLHIEHEEIRKELFVEATLDLALEVRYLSTLSHPNIIKMRGLSSGHAFSGKYFIVLDRLFDTLAVRIKRWSSATKGSKMTLLNRMHCTDSTPEVDLQVWEEILKAAYGIASALKYLHSRG